MSFFREVSIDCESSELVFEDELIQSDAIKPPKYPQKGRSQRLHYEK